MNPKAFCLGWFWQTVSDKLMMLCRDIYALLHVISVFFWGPFYKFIGTQLVLLTGRSMLISSS